MGTAEIIKASLAFAAVFTITYIAASAFTVFIIGMITDWWNRR